MYPLHGLMAAKIRKARSGTASLLQCALPALLEPPGSSLMSGFSGSPDLAIKNAALSGFAFRSKTRLFSKTEKSPGLCHPPSVKITFTVVSTSTGSLLSR